MRRSQKTGSAWQKLKSVRGICVLALGLGGLPQVSHASEISFLSGVLRSESRKFADMDKGRKTEFEVGGRFADVLDKNLHWYSQGKMAIRGYSKGEDGLAPDNSVSLSAGGGVRYYFGKLSENIATFAYGGGEFRLDKDGGVDVLGRTLSVEKNGLYYGGSFGIRLYLGSDFFCDFETPLFDSALFATEKTQSKVRSTNTDQVVTTEDKTTRTDLFVGSTGALNDVKVALGLRF